jgi:hypothetical protein
MPRARWCGRCGALLAPPPHVEAPEHGTQHEEEHTDRGPPDPDGPRRDALPSWLVPLGLALVVVAGVATALAGAGGSPRLSSGTDASSRTEPDTAVTGEDAAPEPADDPPACVDEGVSVACVRWHVPEPATPADAVAGPDGVATLSDEGEVTWRTIGSGATRWERLIDAEGRDTRLLPPWVGVLPIVTDDRLLLLGIQSGRTLATVPLDDDATATMAGGWVLVSDRTGLSAWTMTGDEGWSRPLTDGQRGLVTTAGPYVHDAEGSLTRLHGNTGEDRWTVSLPPGSATPATLATSSDITLALDPDDGEPSIRRISSGGLERWDAPMPGTVTHVALPADHGMGAAVVATDDGEAVVLFDPEDGTSLPPVDLGSGAAGTLPPSVRAHRVAIATTHPRPRLTVVGRDDGFIRMRTSLPQAPSAVALTDDATVLTADTAGVTARSTTTGVRRWGLSLAEAGLVDQEPVVVTSSEGLTAVVPDP